MKNKFDKVWFLLGLGAQLQVIASLSITEAVVLACAPFVFIRTFHQLKKDGVATLLTLAVCVFVGCVVSCVYNHTQMLYAIRGLSVTAIIPCSIIVGHALIRKSPGGFKWFLLGSAISLVLCTFVLQRSVEVSLYGHGSEDADAIMSGPLYWVQRLGGFITLPTQGWYMKTSVWLDVPAQLFVAIFALVTTSSGRSAALGAVGAVAILLLGGKTLKSMKRISRHFGTIFLMGVLGVFMVSTAYRVAAMSGVLGEVQRAKYESQTQGSSSIGRLLLGGRAESFVGILACLDKPIVGWGPWAEDRDGYWAQFISRFGTVEDVENMQKIIAYEARNGICAFRLIQGHSHITMFWLWYGIFGLIFWFYVIYVLFRYLKQDVWAVPQWFGWLACAVPSLLWHIFFSPLSARVAMPIMIVACLMARAVRSGRFVLPQKMQLEIWDKER